MASGLAAHLSVKVDRYITSKLKILYIKKWKYRDGNKSPETRFNVYAYSTSSKTE